jgi:1,4-alpha-glucan branching enzyme
MGRVEATEEPQHAMPASALVRVPPLGAVFLVPEEPPEDTETGEARPA